MTRNTLAEATAPIRNGQLVRIWDPSPTGTHKVCDPSTMSDGANGVATRNPRSNDGWAEGDLVPVRQTGGILAEIDGETCWVEFDAQGRATVVG